MSTEKPNKVCFFSSYVLHEDSPECISRLCNMTVAKIVIPGCLCKDGCKDVYLGLSISDSKQILRSTPIALGEPSGHFYEVDLDFMFSLKYSHYFRRKANVLNVSLQRRRIYNNKVVSGHKTIAFALVDLAWVMQEHDKEILKLSAKSKKDPPVVIQLSTFNSLPAEKSIYVGTGQPDATADIVNSSQSGSDNEVPIHPFSKGSRRLDNERRRTLTKVLDRLKITEELRASIVSLAEKQGNMDTFSDLESPQSCSSIDQETQSSYHPTVRPYFKDCQSSSSMGSSESGNDEIKPLRPDEPQNISKKTSYGSQTVTAEHSPVFPPIRPDKEGPKLSRSLLAEPDISPLIEDLQLCLNDTQYPYKYFFATLEDTFSDKAKTRMLKSNFGSKFLLLSGPRDIRQMFTVVLSRVQNQINTSGTIPLLRICLLSREEDISLFLQALVQFNVPRVKEILEHTQLLYAPVGPSRLANHFSFLSRTYSELYESEEWYSSLKPGVADVTPLISRLSAFVHGNTVPLLLPVAEVCLKSAAASSIEEQGPNQMIVPFIIDVSVGLFSGESRFLTVSEEMTVPKSSATSLACKDSKKNKRHSILRTSSPTFAEPKLLIDYWVVDPDEKGGADKVVAGEKREVKLRGKNDYDVVTISRDSLSANASASEYLQITLRRSQPGGSKIIVGKDVKFKGKKVKEKLQDSLITNINHLVCASKANPFNVRIDGRVWEGVKFFSVSPKWSTNFSSVPFGLPSN